MNYQFDAVVVGSGPAGAHAAYPLVKAGLNVAMIDGGLEDLKKETKQIIIDTIGTNGKKTSHAFDLIKEKNAIFEKTYDLLKIKSNIEIVQSLAKGGLSETWHGICDFFSDSELEAIGLPHNEIKREYDGISKLIKLQFSSPLDLHSKVLLAKATRNTIKENTIYQVPMVFSYRTSSFIEELKRCKNFVYIPNQLVYRVEEKRNHVEIHSLSIDKKDESSTNASFLILAAGSINTTRIILQSFQLYNHKKSFLTKANYVVPCLHVASLGKKNDRKKHKLGQVAIASKERNRGVDSFFIQLYRLNPLFLQKALQYIFLPKKIALPLLSVLAPYIVIADVRFPAFESDMTYCKLKKEAGKRDTLEIVFKETREELTRHKKEYDNIKKQLLSLGLFPLRTIIGYTSSHYAGGLSVDNNGKLHKGSRIYIADSSSWKVLPAKPPTMTIMANASRIGKIVQSRLR